MASTQKVKKYLAYWFQLGKKVILNKNNQTLLPSKIFQGSDYSPEFEDCWREIITNNKGDAYLEGTPQTIQDLLSSKWDIIPCARCEMPVPMIDLGFVSPNCPCADLENWPNQELPQPRAPVKNDNYLRKLSERLENKDSN
jgi:hypothetical protein